jgi:hypothetical protein
MITVNMSNGFTRKQASIAAAKRGEQLLLVNFDCDCGAHWTLFNDVKRIRRWLTAEFSKQQCTAHFQP